jgi:hypothetical protein
VVMALGGAVFARRDWRAVRAERAAGA